MNSKEFFERYYQKQNNDGVTYSKSLLTFFETIVYSKLEKVEHILDLGGGAYSLFEDIKNLEASVLSIDFSKSAISKAPRSKITYKYSLVTDSKYFNFSKYDLVFDSHCLNCITLETERAKAFKNIYKSLNDSGLFASELMVQPIDRTVAMPFKMIKTSLELEQEILSHGFKIVYFMIVRDAAFMNEINGEKISCDVLRVIAKK